MDTLILDEVLLQLEQHTVFLADKHGNYTIGVLYEYWWSLIELVVGEKVFEFIH